MQPELAALSSSLSLQTPGPTALSGVSNISGESFKVGFGMTIFGRSEVVEWKEFEGASVCQLTECIEMIEEVVEQSVRYCLNFPDQEICRGGAVTVHCTVVKVLSVQL